MKRYGYVYKHINKINNKVYIGQSVQKFSRRCRKKDKTYRSYKSCPAFYHALQKYGWENFESTILEYVDTQEELDALESKYINEYNSYAPNGYNIAEFSDGGGHHAESTKEKIRQKRLLYYKNKETPNIAPNLKEHIFEDGIEKKFCSGHKVYHPLNEFTKHKSRWDGLHHYCKAIGKEKTAEYRAKNPTKKLSKEEWQNSYKNRKKTKERHRYYARKCDVRVVELAEQKKFLSENHRQNYVPSQYAYGLYFNEELVVLMTFGRPRFTDEYEYELLRFCSKTNCQVIGGASKLYTHFVRTHGPKSIISYANKAYSKGNVYEVLGMEYSHDSQNSYYYEKDGIQLSRYKCQKHKLFYLLGEKFDPNKTEEQNMTDAGYKKVIIPGNLVYVKKW